MSIGYLLEGRCAGDLARTDGDEGAGGSTERRLGNPDYLVIDLPRDRDAQ
jgi:hypothetical protein